MSRIRILPEILSNKIAAGEVVERPASVVKELVENALDAGSTQITVEIKSGGKSLIQIADDGVGMSHDDALLALERYATSKIHTDEDLFAIRTLGFRGEALPSIASVSRFTLITREASADIGTGIEVAGGTIKNVTEVGAPPGTLIRVQNLFYNTPARRKFLKATTTETAHVADTLTRVALSWPQVQFKLIHNGKTVKHWIRVTDARQRVIDILGKDVKNALLPVSAQTPAVKVEGWVAGPEVTRSTGRGLFVFVNGRFVKDRIVQHALFQAYKGRLMKGRYPLGVLFITLAFDQVDVNVHPTKHEVRFADANRVHFAVEQGIRKALADRQRPGDPPAAAADALFEPGTPYQPAYNESNVTVRSQGAAPAREPGGRATSQPLRSRAEWAKVMSPEPEYAPQIQKDHGEPDARPAVNTGVAAEQQSLWQQARFADLKVVGQIRNTYLICEADDGLILIDQHAAHERVYFEMLQKRRANTRAPSQKLLVPETLEFSHREAEILERLIGELAPYGLEIAPFGGTTFVVSAVPVILANRPMEPLVRELVEKMADVGFGDGLAGVIDDCLAVMACHSVIRARQPLTELQIKTLLKQLDTCENPSNCPHGRPTWLHWDWRFIEKSFKRIV